MQTRSENGKAPVGGTTEASSVNNPNQKGINMIDSKAVQVSSQPTFSFGDNKVRVIVRDGEPWFVASDVCGALDYKNTSKAIGDHLDDDEKGLTTGYTLGGEQKLTVISESGLYALVLRSRKPEARKFAKWVTSEVLPAIRKTGVYVGKPFTVNPGDVLTQEEQNTLRQMIEGMAKKLSADTKVQGRFIMQAWSKLKSHFKVSYREIPRLELTEAISIINRHTLEWEVVDEVPYQPVSPLNAPELTAARKVAEEYFDNFREAVKAGKPNPAMGEIPQDVLQGMVSRAVVSQRTLSWFDWQTGRMCCKLVESDASVFSLASGDYDDLMESVPMERVPEMLEAINRRVASHIGAFSDHLKRSRTPAVNGAFSLTGVIHA